MANTTNYAQVWQKRLLDIVIQETLTSPFIVRDDNEVNWLDGKTFHFTQMATSGYRNHVVGAEIKAGKYTQTDKAYTISHDRDFSLLLDKLENLESGGTATIENINKTFQKVHASKEVDALFFEKVSTAALASPGFFKQVAQAEITKANVLEYVLGSISKVKKYRNTAICYVSTYIMDLIELALADKARVNITTISDYKNSIQTRVASVQGVPVIEVIDDACFKTKQDYKDDENGGFAKNVGGKDIHILVASRLTCKTIKKIQSIYVMEPGTHTRGDGWFTYTRDCWDTFVLPNGLDGKVDSVYIVHNDK